MDDVLYTAAEESEVREYLIFTVDSIDFGIDIGLVQEIIKIQPITSIPNALDFCVGILNLRGTIIPVLDMRIKLGFDAVEYDERACIVVIMLESELIGVIVDMVQDVIRIPENELIDSPPVLSNGRQSYTAKIACTDDKIRQIIDVNTVFCVNGI
ncbi:MAG TPA: purine-binding chemotaxis protein CheW [Clostridiales bacterium]|nr:purine-binding chemotaxis protein CheW [Clostridiales bacterium]